MESPLALLGTMLFVGFAVCCTASGLLQGVAWWRHRLEGQGVNPSALWKPEGYFDPIGLRQMRLARRLMLVGAVMYLSYGVLILVATGVDTTR
jgi:hypothetical protein